MARRTRYRGKSRYKPLDLTTSHTDSTLGQADSSLSLMAETQQSKASQTEHLGTAWADVVKSVVRPVSANKTVRTATPDSAVGDLEPHSPGSAGMSRMLSQDAIPHALASDPKRNDSAIDVSLWPQPSQTSFQRFIRKTPKSTSKTGRNDGHNSYERINTIGPADLVAEPFSVDEMKDKACYAFPYCTPELEMDEGGMDEKRKVILGYTARVDSRMRIFLRDPADQGDSSVGKALIEEVDRHLTDDTMTMFKQESLPSTVLPSALAFHTMLSLTCRPRKGADHSYSSSHCLGDPFTYRPYMRPNVPTQPSRLQQVNWKRKGSSLTFSDRRLTSHGHSQDVSSGVCPSCRVPDGHPVSEY
jgi:hypothetical protein